MTLNLRSDNRVSARVGNVHGMLGPSDFRAMLDFGREEYYTLTAGVRADYLLDEAVSVARTSIAPYVSRSGELLSAPANSPRRHYINAYDTEGLLITGARTNLAASAVTATITVPAAAASNRVIASFEGGDVTLTAAQLTLVETWTDGARTVRSYSRNTGSGFSATMTVSGGATRVQVEDGGFGNLATPFAGYSTTVAAETVTLKSPFRDLLSAGEGTVVVRSIMLPHGASDSRTYSAIGIRSASPIGGASLNSSRTTVSAGTDSVRTFADGASWGAGAAAATLVGSWRDNSVHALGIDNFGADVRMAAYGQVNAASSVTPTFGAPADIYVGFTPGVSDVLARLNGIVTHVVIYDRLLTSTEFGVVANLWI